MDIKKNSIESLDKPIQELVASYVNFGGINHRQGPNLPSRQAVVKALIDIQTLIFPGFKEEEGITEQNLSYLVGELVHRSAKILMCEIEKSLDYKYRLSGLNGCPEACHIEARELVLEFFTSLPNLRIKLMEDVNAAYKGDPAAKSIEEVILAYPGLEAVVAHRVANFFWKARLPLIPRMMSEYIHSKSGIDIHPGAELEGAIFIDHGTGVVIGETAVIGKNVKIYQGVTLGALSVKKELGSVKRHPTIEKNVTIYSGATILGGKTVIGEGSIIGGNVWLTHSVPPYSRVYLPEGNLARIEMQFLDRGASI